MRGSTVRGSRARRPSGPAPQRPRCGPAGPVRRPGARWRLRCPCSAQGAREGTGVSRGSGWGSGRGSGRGSSASAAPERPGPAWPVRASSGQRSLPAPGSALLPRPHLSTPSSPPAPLPSPAGSVPPRRGDEYGHHKRPPHPTESWNHPW